MQVCISLQTDNHASTPPLKFFYSPDALPATQPTTSKHWRQMKANSTYCQKRLLRQSHRIRLQHWGWKCHTWAAPSCDILNLMFIIYITYAAVKHLPRWLRLHFLSPLTIVMYMCQGQTKLTKFPPHSLKGKCCRNYVPVTILMLKFHWCHQWSPLWDMIMAFAENHTTVTIMVFMVIVKCFFLHTFQPPHGHSICCRTSSYTAFLHGHSHLPYYDKVASKGK